MTIRGITSEPVKSISELIDLAEQLSNTRSEWAFRGQSRSHGTLIPSFQRIFKEKRSVATAKIIERDLIKVFREHYGALQGKNFDMPDLFSIDHRYDLRCLSVMQHYGVPTRLLDWTTNFWTAIYFACASDPANEAEFWLYDRNIFNEQHFPTSEFHTLYIKKQIGATPPMEPLLLSGTYETMIVELDPKITPRMGTQNAHHTVSSDMFADHSLLLLNLSLKKELINEQHPPFRRILIAAECKEKALRFLEDEHKITAATIFPDVEGLSKFLYWHLESLVTTLL